MRVQMQILSLAELGAVNVCGEVQGRGEALPYGQREATVMTPPCLPLGFCWCLHLDYNDFDDSSFETMLSQQATQKLSGASSHAL